MIPINIQHSSIGYKSIWYWLIPGEFVLKQTQIGYLPMFLVRFLYHISAE